VFVDTLGYSKGPATRNLLKLRGAFCDNDAFWAVAKRDKFNEMTEVLENARNRQETDMSHNSTAHFSKLTHIAPLTIIHSHGILKPLGRGC